MEKSRATYASAKNNYGAITNHQNAFREPRINKEKKVCVGKRNVKLKVKTSFAICRCSACLHDVRRMAFGREIDRKKKLFGVKPPAESDATGSEARFKFEAKGKRGDCNELSRGKTRSKRVEAKKNHKFKRPGD